MRRACLIPGLIAAAVVIGACGRGTAAPVSTTLPARAPAPAPAPAAADTAPAAQAPAGIDSALAIRYMSEIQSLCEREGGRLWGVSLCGPIVIADPFTKAIVTNAPVPAAPRPAMLGYANSAVQWGDARWTAVVWQHLSASDDTGRRVLMMHEMFHRIQPQLGFMLAEPDNSHLDTYDGRVWLQLEWRALAAALRASGTAERTAALRDALAFRAARHELVPGAAENERVLEINEGLAQYTGTVVVIPSPAEAAANVVRQLDNVTRNASFVRTFAYPTGAAYGLFLDEKAPGWTRRVRPTDDLAALLVSATNLRPSDDRDAAAERYGAGALREMEKRRAAEHAARVAEYRQRFVDGPVLTLPKGRSASFQTNGMTPIPGAGLVYPVYRTTTDWGKLEAALVLVSDDGRTLALPAPTSPEGTTLQGEGWTLELAAPWVVRPGARAGDFVVVRGADAAP